MEFGVEIGEYRGVVRVAWHVFQRLLPDRPTPERCVEAYYLQCTPERKLRQRQLTDDGNVGISLRDLRKASSGNCADSGECLKSTQSCCSLPSIAMPAHSPEKGLAVPRSIPILFKAALRSLS